MKKFVDSRQMDSEAHRHQCEVRELLKWRLYDGHWDRVTRYLDDPRVKRRSDKLKNDLRIQFRKGNQAKEGEWYE